MPVADSNVATISANGSTDWVALRPGDNVVSVAAATWGGTTTVALEQSDDATDATKSQVKIDGTPVVLAQANDRFVLTGPGYVRGVVNNYAGSTEISIKRIHPN